MRFKDVLEKAKALAGIRGRLMVTAEEAYKEIGKPVYQYEETLWQFVKRIAGRCNTLVIPEVTYDLPQL
jgi:spore maturation protein CgeB